MKLVLDACTVINLLQGDSLSGILRLRDVTAYIGSLTLRECARHRQAVDVELRANALELIEGHEVPGGRFLELLQTYGLGEGETESIVLCEYFGYTLATDDKRARQVAAGFLGDGRVTGSLGLLRVAVAAGQISASKANESLAAMRAAGGFLPRVDDGFFARTQ